jgi:hypothetical protein
MVATAAATVPADITTAFREAVVLVEFRPVFMTLSHMIWTEKKKTPVAGTGSSAQ